MSGLEIMIFLGAAGVAWLVFRLLMPRKVDQRKRKRLVRRQTEHLAATGPLARFDNWFARLVRLGGAPWEPTTTASLIGGLAVVIGAAAFVATERISVTIWAALASMLLCIVVLNIAYHRMVAQFERQLPLALDLMARAVSAGESLDQAIQLVSESVEEPARSEFLRCHNQLAMGLSVRAAMGSLVNRVDTLNVRIMGSILAVHRETGGNLAETLHRLSVVIRNRFDYYRRLRTVTGAGRVSLLIVVVLAWGLFGYLFLGQPDYGSQFFESVLGTKMLTVAVVLEVIGVLWGWMLLKKNY